MIKTISTIVLMLGLLFIPSTSWADTPGCVTWDEFKSVNPGSVPSTGTHRNVVRNRFGDNVFFSKFTYRPYGSDTPPGPNDPNNWAEGHDYYFKSSSCDNSSVYVMFYNRYVSPGPSGDTFWNLGKKCNRDGSGGAPDRCWT